MVNGLFTVSPSLKGCGICCRHCSARMHWIECQSGDNHSILKKEEPTCVSASPSLCSCSTLLQYISGCAGCSVMVVVVTRPIPAQEWVSTWPGAPCRHRSREESYPRPAARSTARSARSRAETAQLRAQWHQTARNCYHHHQCARSDIWRQQPGRLQQSTNVKTSKNVQQLMWCSVLHLTHPGSKAMDTRKNTVITSQKKSAKL